MIPKRAIFHWEGDPMGGLRRRCIERFRSLNPDWSVVVLDAKTAGAPSNLLPPQRSDWSRWIELYERGGYAFDTDMAFARPIPEWMLETDLAMPADGENVNAVCVMGAAPGHPFMALMNKVARETYEKGWHTYQDFGTLLLWRSMGRATGGEQHARIGQACIALELKPPLLFPAESFNPIRWEDAVNALDRPQPPYAGMPIAVHWYGGANGNPDAAQAGSWVEAALVYRDEVAE